MDESKNDALDLRDDDGTKVAGLQVEWTPCGNAVVCMFCLICKIRMRPDDMALARANHTGHDCLMLLRGPL